MRSWILMICVALSCCGQPGEEPLAEGQREVRGTLVSHPSNVKSVEAWLGHQWAVNGTPVKPSEQVPEERLAELVGQVVVARGTWDEGTLWEGETGPASYPDFAEPGKTRRGDGIVLASLEKAE